jgi:molybdopterin converting factor small subunit
MKLIVSGNLMRFTEYQKEIPIDATTVLAALEVLVERYPGLRPVVFDGQGNVRSVHRLHLNGEAIGSQLDRPLAPDDEVGLLTALAGG